MPSAQVVIAILLIVGVFGFLSILALQLGKLATLDDSAKQTLLKLTDPASLVSLTILLGILFLLGMAILDLDKGQVLVGMGRAPFARGLITYLFAVVTIGTAVVLVLSALLGTDKEKFDRGKEVLGLLLGVFGTIVGFYFASELAASDGHSELRVSTPLVAPTETTGGSDINVTATVSGGTPPYRFAITFGDEPPASIAEVVRPDGWIVWTVRVPPGTVAGASAVVLTVRDMSGNATDTRSLVTVRSTQPAPAP